MTRRFAARVSGPTRRLVARRGVWLRGLLRPTATVVVLVTDDNVAFLAECLDLLSRPRGAVDEVALVTLGRGRDTAEILRTQVRDRPWARLAGTSVPQALARAVGRYVAVVEAGDPVDATGIRARVTALERSGALVAVAGPEARAAVTLHDHPEAALETDLTEWLCRAEVLRRVPVPALATPTETWRWAVRVLSGGAAFDVVEQRVRAGQRRGSGASFSAMPRLAPGAEAWAETARAGLAELDRAGLTHAATLSRGWLLGEVAPRYLDDAEQATPRQWSALVGIVRELAAATPAARRHEVGVEDRVRLWLAENDRRRCLEEYAAARWLAEGQFETVVAGQLVRARLECPDVPQEELELAPHETQLTGILRRARWSDEHVVTVELLAFVRHVGNQHGPATLGVTLRSEGDSGSVTAVALAATPVTDPELNLRVGQRHQDHARAAYTVDVDVAALAKRGAGSWRLDLDWRLGELERHATLTAADRDGSAARLSPGRVGGLQARLELDPVRLVLAPGAAAPPRTLDRALTTVALDGDALVVRGRAPGAGLLEVVGARGRAGVEAVPHGGVFDVTVPLRHDPWGLGATPLPSAAYRLLFDGHPVPPDPALVDDLPLFVRSAAYRLQVRAAGEGTEIVLRRPLREDEVGAWAQERLRRWYAGADHEVDPQSVFLQSYTGEVATDSPLAIHHAVRRLRPDLRLRWGVADRSTPVPEGGEPVLVRSREWYAALARSAYLVTNADLEEWLVKRPGQRLLQTYHGYPAKAMGIAAWETKNLSPLRIERRLRQTSGTWDLLLTPTPEMDRHYRREYRYDGPILAQGYPRDDDLVGPEAERIRAQTRRRLGLGDRVAVLYAPTWRDNQATGFRSAPAPLTFDVEAAALSLGPGYAVLVRGHRFHRRSRPAQGVLDVTDYPEINDLVLACDVAIVDYSSLRFDLVLAGRPVVFLVPDLDRYEGEVRGFLFGFRDSAPGPLVETTADAVSAVQDLPTLLERFAPARRAFDSRFHRYQDGRAAERVVAAFFGDRPG